MEGPSKARRIYPNVLTDTGVSERDNLCNVLLRKDKLDRKLLRPTEVRSGLRSRTRVWRERLVCRDTSRAFNACIGEEEGEGLRRGVME